MRILPATTHPSGTNVAYAKLMQCLERQAPASGAMQWTDHAANADAVLFVDNDYMSPDRFVRRLLLHPLARRFGASSYLFSNTDWPAPYFPGIFPSLTPHQHAAGRNCSSHYLSTEIPAIPLDHVEETDRDWLYSFTGRVSTSPVRERVMLLTGGRGLCTEVRAAPDAVDQVRDYRERYWAIMAHSHFVLCPRGYGSSSFRLFEAMQCGRAPVIVSDAWVPPQGPDWASFSIRVPERRVADIPKILGQHEAQSARMGALARAAWQRWFSDGQTPQTLLGYVEGLAQAGTLARITGNAWWSARTLMGARQLRSLASWALRTQQP